MPAHYPLSTLADAAMASSGTCHCYPEWHNFPVYLLLSTADIIENEHISILKQAFLPLMSLSLQNTMKL